MMGCLYIFKDKSKSNCNSKSKTKRDTNSASGLKNRTRSQNNSLSTNRSLGSLPSPKSLEELYEEKEHNLRVFSYQELRDATHVFNRVLKLGEGGFGKVYKGSVRSAGGQGDPFFVAIKRLNQLGLQGHKQWLAEVQFLGIVNHPNLVRLLGHCSEDYDGGIHRLLVYEYMPNRSLEDHLFSKALPPLPWVTRLEIMLGAAQGLTYLHEDLEVQVIYRDFKPSNVLLDSSFKAKLSDFGLAREGPTNDKSHVSTAPVGTYGYAAPEYVNTGHLTVLSDVWSYGVVLYEVLSGRRSIERDRPTAEQKLLEWIKQFPPESKQFSIIIDPRLRNQYSVGAARKVAKLADTCLNKNAKERPSMRQVAHTLREAIKLESQACNLSENQGSVAQQLR